MSPILPRCRCAAAVAAALLCSHALCQNLGTVPVFVVNQPWVAPARKAQTTHAYMNLTSTDGATLLSARSDDARRVSLRSAHSAAAAGLALPARSEVSLAPGHDHLALIGLTQALRIGDRVRITLTVRDDDGAVHEIAVNAEVRHRSPVDDERRAHHHH
jgi:periplasmic copper chaperone A